MIVIGSDALNDNVDLIFVVFIMALTFNVHLECENLSVLYKILSATSVLPRQELKVHLQQNLDSVLRGEGHKLSRSRITRSSVFPATALPVSGFFVEIGAHSMLSLALDTHNWNGVTVDAQMNVVSNVSAQRTKTVIHGLVTSERSKTILFKSRSVPTLQLQSLISQNNTRDEFCAVIVNCKHNLQDVLLSISDFSAVNACIIPNTTVTPQAEQILLQNNFTIFAKHKNYLVWKPILFLQK